MRKIQPDNRVDAPMPICMCAFLWQLLETRLCVVRGISGCGLAVAHGCVFRMSLRNPFPLKSASPGPGVRLRKGAVRDADTHPCDDPLIQPVAGESPHPQKSTCHHVCVCVRRSVSSSSMKSRPLSSAESTAHLPCT